MLFPTISTKRSSAQSRSCLGLDPQVSTLIYLTAKRARLLRNHELLRSETPEEEEKNSLRESLLTQNWKSELQEASMSFSLALGLIRLSSPAKTLPQTQKSSILPAEKSPQNPISQAIIIQTNKTLSESTISAKTNQFSPSQLGTTPIQENDQKQSPLQNPKPATKFTTTIQNPITKPSSSDSRS